MAHSKLTPETDSQRNLRLLAMAIVDAKNALSALEDQGNDRSLPPSKRGPVATDEQIEAAQDAVNAAELAWNRARLAEVA